MAATNRERLRVRIELWYRGSVDPRCPVEIGYNRTEGTDVLSDTELCRLISQCRVPSTFFVQNVISYVGSTDYKTATISQNRKQVSSQVGQEAVEPKFASRAQYGIRIDCIRKFCWILKNNNYAFINLFAVWNTINQICLWIICNMQLKGINNRVINEKN